MRAEDLLSFCALGVLDLLVVQEADLRREVQKPGAVVLHHVSMPFLLSCEYAHTSLFVTGLSTNDTKVNFLNPLSTSKSASSATLFWVKTSVLSAGTLLTTFASMRWILFLAHSSVWSLGL
jgi:hypothetical protein